MARLIVDTDTAQDDAFSLLLALRTPGVQLEAITVVAGNVPYLSPLCVVLAWAFFRLSRPRLWVRATGESPGARTRRGSTCSAPASWPRAVRPGRGVHPLAGLAVLGGDDGGGGMHRAGRLLPPDQRAVLEGLPDGRPLSILGETPPEVDAEGWERAFAILVQYGWAEPGPPPRLTAQGDAALTHDRSLRYELVANAMLGVLRDM